MKCLNKVLVLEVGKISKLAHISVPELLLAQSAPPPCGSQRKNTPLANWVKFSSIPTFKIGLIVIVGDFSTFWLSFNID